MSSPKIQPALTGLLAVALIALTAVTTVEAQGSLQATLTVRPVTQGDIAAYKLPQNTSVSGGLYTVALGEPLYLEAQINSSIPASDVTGVTWALVYKPVGSTAALADSPLGSNVPVFEPSDRAVVQVAGRSLLRPDLEGEYVVEATVTTATNGTADLAQTFVAGKFVGKDTCNMCHGGLMPENLSAPWSQTLHASMFTNGINGVDGDHYGTACIGCHTLGYDPNAPAANGGFFDIASQLKWSFPSPPLKAGNWDAVPSQLKGVANIQCENCHGPGSVHVTGSFEIGISKSMSSGVCSQCHDAPSHHIKSAEWNNSMHAVTTRDPAGSTGCVGCHTGAGFVGKMTGATNVDTTYTAINCQTCHEPHGVTAPSSNPHLIRTLATVTLAGGTTVEDAGMGTLCMNCHQSRRKAATYAANTPGSSRFGPHHGPQADMLEGVNAFTYGQTIPSSAHASVVKDTCVACHMQTVDATNPAFLQAGGHTFKPSWSPDGKTSQNLVAVCQGCHGTDVTQFDFPLMDYNGDGTIDGVQTEVQHLLDQLSSLLPPAGQPKTSLTIDSTWTQPQLEAAYNWQFVHDDGSKGIHNTAYAVGVLKASIANLTAQK